MGYLVNGPVMEGLVEVGNLILTVLHAHQVRPGQETLRLAGFAGTPARWGVRWGGADQRRFLKDLLLQPVPGGPGLRINVDRTDLLRLGLALERELDRRVRNPRLPIHRRILLPNLWAAFREADAAAVTGGGPELADYARQERRSADELLADFRRTQGGMVLYPLAWVSHHWQQAVTVFADLERFPRRQVFSIRRLPDDLVGFQAAAEFDFHSRFRPAARHRPSRRETGARLRVTSGAQDPAARHGVAHLFGRPVPTAGRAANGSSAYAAAGKNRPPHPSTPRPNSSSSMSGKAWSFTSPAPDLQRSPNDFNHRASQLAAGCHPRFDLDSRTSTAAGAGKPAAALAKPLEAP